jgi:hypothetical protein
MGPAVVPGQDLAEVPGPVGHGAVADLAARDRRWVTVTGKRRELELLITSDEASLRNELALRHTHATRHP